MFTLHPKNDPLLGPIKLIIEQNDRKRAAVNEVNKQYRITDKRQLPLNLHEEYDRKVQEILAEKQGNTPVSTPVAPVSTSSPKSTPEFINESVKDNSIVNEAVANLLEKDELTESEYNTIMESDFGQAFTDARMAGKAEFDWNGKKYHSRKAGESDADWKSYIAKNSGPPVPAPRRADRMPTAQAPAADSTPPNSDNTPIQGISNPRPGVISLNGTNIAAGKASPDPASTTQSQGISNPEPGVISLNGTRIAAGKASPDPAPQASAPAPTNVQQVVPGATPAPSPNGSLIKRSPWESSWVQNSKP